MQEVRNNDDFETMQNHVVTSIYWCVVMYILSFGRSYLKQKAYNNSLNCLIEKNPFDDSSFRY